MTHKHIVVAGVVLVGVIAAAPVAGLIGQFIAYKLLSLLTVASL